jgi:hypothetical protein
VSSLLCHAPSGRPSRDRQPLPGGVPRRVSGRLVSPLLLVVAVVGALAVGCSSEKTTSATPTAVSITFTLASYDILVGVSEQAVPTVSDINGVTIDSAPVSWASSNPAVATITSTGIITGVAQGLANIIATSGSVADTQLLTVETPATIAIDSVRPAQLIAGQTATIFGHNFSAFVSGDIVTIAGDTIVPTTVDSTQITIAIPDTSCLPAATVSLAVVARGSAAAVSSTVAPNITPITLGVGQVAALGQAAAGCIEFTANAATAQYIVIYGNVTSSLDASAPFELSMTIGNTTPLGYGGYGHVASRFGRAHKAKAAPRARTPHHLLTARAQPKTKLRVKPPSTTVEAKIRSYEHAHLARVPLQRRTRASTASAPAVGDMVTYNVPISGCDSGQYVATTGVVQYVGAHGIFVQDAQTPAGGFADSDFVSMSNEYDQYVYPTDSVHFGGPSDIDDNQHVILYFTPQINKQSTSGSASFNDGYFFAGDLLTPSNCPESNQAEIIYLAVPDPTGAVGVTQPTTAVRQLSRTTFAHEMQQLINAGNRYFKSGGELEDPWLNEALSYLSEDFVGRAEYGYTDLQQMTYALVSADANTYAAFFQSNVDNYAGWLAEPSAYGAIDSRADSALPDTMAAVRGAAWSMMRYTADQYSGGVPAALTRALAYGPNTGVFNLQTSVSSVSGASVPLDSLEEGWLLASYTSGSGLAVAPKYTFVSYNMQDVETGAFVTYPLVPDSILIASQVVTSVTGALQGNAGFYINLASLPPVPSISLELLNGDGTYATFPGARVFILRVQ